MQIGTVFKKGNEELYQRTENAGTDSAESVRALSRCATGNVLEGKANISQEVL